MADITRAMEQIRASFGRIDVLFVNAGIAIGTDLVIDAGRIQL